MHEIILGLVQGLTEFLPVSSSGHLVLVPGMLGWGEPPLGLTVLLHMGTLVALIIYFRNDILGLILGVLDLAKGDLVISAGSLTGTLVSGLVGFASIHYLLRFVRTHSLNVFAWYLFAFAPLSALVIWLR